MLGSRAIQPAEKSSELHARGGGGADRASLARAEAKRGHARAASREDEVRGYPKSAALRVRLLSLVLSFVPALGTAPACAQGSVPSRPWLDPALLAAAKAEGSLIVYSSTNEQEGLPLFKLFTEATGIKVDYVRASDAVLLSRMAIEFRADQKSHDIVHMTTINKLPPAMLAAYEPPEAKNIMPQARDGGQRSE